MQTSAYFTCYIPINFLLKFAKLGIPLQKTVVVLARYTRLLPRLNQILPDLTPKSTTF